MQVPVSITNYTPYFSPPTQVVNLGIRQFREVSLLLHSNYEEGAKAQRENF